MNNIKTAREKMGLNQKELAAAIGVSQPTVCDWEAGRKTPSGKNAEKLCSLLGESADYLLYGRQSEHTVDDEDIKFALFGAREIDDELYEEVKRFAEYVSSKRSKKTKEGNNTR